MGWFRRHRVSCVIVLAAMAATAAYYPHSQQAKMAKAERHIAVLRQLLAADPRFNSLQFEPFTGRGGSLLVRGTLASQADREAAIAIVQASNAPVEVVYRIELPDATKPSESVVLRLDNHGGVAYGGHRITVFSNGTCTWQVYTDARGADQPPRQGACTLDEAAGVVTVTIDGERDELRRVVRNGVRYWLDERRLAQVGGREDEEAWYGALREEP